jgi:hypothetical protein
MLSKKLSACSSVVVLARQLRVELDHADKSILVSDTD